MRQEATITGYVYTAGGMLDERTFWVDDDGSVMGGGGELLPVLGEEPVELAGWAFSRAIVHAYGGDGVPVLIGQAHDISRKQIVALGGKVWAKGRISRIYFNDLLSIFGVEFAKLKMATPKLWMDCERGEIQSNFNAEHTKMAVAKLLEMAEIA
jgi:hypothetical protein